jgi:hypothetical protein
MLKPEFRACAPQASATDPDERGGRRRTGWRPSRTTQRLTETPHRARAHMGAPLQAEATVPMTPRPMPLDL